MFSHYVVSSVRKVKFAIRVATMGHHLDVINKAIPANIASPQNPINSKLLSATEEKRHKDATLREEGECSHVESNHKPSDP
jgi:hypothetical protein